MSKIKHLPYENLKVKLFQHKISYSDLAKLLNLSETAVSHKINGKSDFMLQEAIRVSEFAKIDIKNFTN